MLCKSCGRCKSRYSCIIKILPALTGAEFLGGVFWVCCAVIECETGGTTGGKHVKNVLLPRSHKRRLT